jgi:lactoylglutathione lyase
MRLYLKSKGIAVPDSTPKGKSGNSNFMIRDPEGHQVEIVQYEPTGWSMRDKGKALPESRISTHIRHMGLIADETRTNEALL